MGNENQPQPLDPNQVQEQNESIIEREPTPGPAAEEESNTESTTEEDNPNE